MAVVEELIRAGEGSISFGNYTLGEKAKKEDFEHQGAVYKVKTFSTMTKLEKNGNFAYESVPGTSVVDFKESEKGISFKVEGNEDAQLTLGLEPECEYLVKIDGRESGRVKANLGGKLSISVELDPGREVLVEVEK